MFRKKPKKKNIFKRADDLIEDQLYKLLLFKIGPFVTIKIFILDAFLDLF